MEIQGHYISWKVDISFKSFFTDSSLKEDTLLFNHTLTILVAVKTCANAADSGMLKRTARNKLTRNIYLMKVGKRMNIHQHT